MKDYSELTSKIYVQLSPELSQEFHNMLTDMAKEISRLYEIENAKPSEALELVEKEIENINLKLKKDIKLRDKTNPHYHSFLENCCHRICLYESRLKELSTIKQALLKAQEQEKLLSIIKEKEVDIHLLKRSSDWLDYYTRFKHRTGKNTELTEEEFELLKRWLNE